MDGADEWLSIARTADPDELRDRILTGYKTGKPFTPYVPTVPLPAPITWVLDFGCGIGRNFPYLNSIARHVAGFDLPPMIERCRSLAGESVALLSDDWRDVAHRRFDLIYASLVLQHVEPEACERYLQDFAVMAPHLYVLTRLQSDFDRNVLGMVADLGLFEAQECVEVEHDDERHQLRRLGTRSFAELIRSAGDGHFEILLRRKSA